MSNNYNLHNIPTREESTAVNNINNNSNQYYFSRNNNTTHLEKSYTSAIFRRQNEEKEDFPSNKANSSRLTQQQLPSSTDAYRLLEPFSPRPGDVDDLDRIRAKFKSEERDTSPSSFDLDKILNKYGDNNEILQLILSSKLEEDRRGAEEAKLRRRELDYILLSKEDVCQNCYKEKSNDDRQIKSFKANENKGKEKENTTSSIYLDNNQQSAPKSLFQDKDFLSFDSTTKRKTRDNDDDEEQQQLQQHLFLPSTVSSYSNKVEDYFSTMQSPSFISSTQYDVHGVHTKKRHSSLNQIYASSLASASPGGGSGSALSTPTELPTRQLQSLDYLTSRRNSLGPFSPSTYQRPSYSARTSSIEPNTLPPISSVSPLLLQDQTRSRDRDIPNAATLSSLQEPQSSTHISYTTAQNHSSSTTRSNDHNPRFSSLPALDSFEASIMESLPFDNKSNFSSPTADETNNASTNSRYKRSGNNIAAQNSSSTPTGSSKKQINIKHSSHPPNKNKLSLNNKDKKFTSTATSSSSSNILKNNEAPSSSKKLPLPPNPSSSSQASSDASLRPRRRRREMQAITMIIETREFPYNDEYVWKNNGNTIHKSSGQKSIYYKCSNSNAGCPVNKTITFKDDGEYLIKYRGSHLEECSKIKRIVNV